MAEEGQAKGCAAHCKCKPACSCKNCESCPMPQCRHQDDGSGESCYECGKVFHEHCSCPAAS